MTQKDSSKTKLAEPLLSIPLLNRYQDLLGTLVAPVRQAHSSYHQQLRQHLVPMLIHRHMVQVQIRSHMLQVQINIFKQHQLPLLHLLLATLYLTSWASKCCVSVQKYPLLWTRAEKALCMLMRSNSKCLSITRRLDFASIPVHSEHNRKFTTCYITTSWYLILSITFLWSEWTKHIKYCYFCFQHKFHQMPTWKLYDTTTLAQKW
jgi:hypothetical protein